MNEETKKLNDEINDAIRRALKARGIGMTPEEAKRIIIEDPEGNIVKRMEAIAVAKYYLGENCSMKEVWEWAERG